MVQPYMVQTRQAFERTRSVANLPSRGTSRAGALPNWPPLMSNVKHHEGSGDRRSIDSTIRGSWRHRAPSRTTLLAVHLYGSAVDGGLKPHKDIVAGYGDRKA